MNDEEKWEYLSSIPAVDSNHPAIRRLAKILNIATEIGNQATRTIRYVDLVMTVARDWIRQTSDINRTGGEDIAGLTRQPTSDDAIEALNRGEDDCDAKARLFVALCLANDINAEMVPKWNMVEVAPNMPNGRTLTHVSAKVQINGRWWPVELTLARAKPGEIGENVPKEKETGQWRLS
jgi:transglutaminase-like putative cysteine protease